MYRRMEYTKRIPLLTERGLNDTMTTMKARARCTSTFPYSRLDVQCAHLHGHTDFCENLGPFWDGGFDDAAAWYTWPTGSQAAL